MTDFPPAVHRLAERYEVPLETAAFAYGRTIAAFKQAAAEFGIAGHPDGKCPSAGCQCSPLEPLITARANELLGLATGSADAGRA
jgi:hypothetical protein